MRASEGPGGGVPRWKEENRVGNLRAGGRRRDSRACGTRESKKGGAEWDSRVAADRVREAGKDRSKGFWVFGGLEGADALTWLQPLLSLPQASGVGTACLRRSVRTRLLSFKLRSTCAYCPSIVMSSHNEPESAQI